MRIDPYTLPLPNEPYRGILPFRLLDWRIFLEREIETERLGNYVSMYGAVLLYGQSGTGKSSLLNAGLLPDGLRHGLAPERIRVFPERKGALVIERIRLQDEHGQQIPELPVYVPSRFAPADGDDHVAVSCEEFKRVLFTPSELGVPLLIFDQFEELVTLFEENPKDKARFDEARATRRDIEALLRDLLRNQTLPLKIVFAFRDDYLARLTPLFSSIPDLMDQRVLLLPPRVERLTEIVRGPFVASADGERGLPGHFQPELSEELAEKVATGISVRRPSGLVSLSEMQMLCLALWRQPARCQQLLQAADAAVVLGQIIESESLAPIKDFSFWDRRRTLALLSNLITEDGTRNVVSEINLIGETTRNPLLWVFRGNLQKLLGQLIDKTGLLRRSLSAGNTYYELSSEFLIPWIQKQKEQLRKQGLMIWRSAFGLVLLMFLSVGFMAYQTNKARQNAVAARKDADALIIFMQHDLFASLEELGHLKMMDTVNSRILKYHDDHSPDADDLDALGERALAYEYHGDVQRSQGDLADALKSYQESLSIREKLVKREPGAVRWQRDLSISHNMVGDVQREQGDQIGALKNYQDGLAIREKLAKQDPSNADRQVDLTGSYTRIGDVHLTQNDRPGASKSFQDSVAIWEKLTKQDPSNAEWQSFLTVSYDRIGDVQRDQGDRTAALKSYQDSLDIREKLARQDPSNAGWQRNLAVSYERIGDVQRDQGDRTAALKRYQNSLDIREKLARQDPSNAGWQSDLSISYDRIGDVQRDQGDRTAALKSYQDSLDIREKLARQDPSNAGWQRDLSVSYEKIGDEQRWNQGDRTAALKSFQNSLSIREKLARQDPSNAGWQRDLSLGYGKIGDVQRDQDDYASALRSYRESLAIAERLARKDPNHAEWQGDLAYSDWQIGSIWPKVDPAAKTEARAMIVKGRDILRTLNESVGLTSTQKAWLTDIEDDLRKTDSGK